MSGPKRRKMELSIAEVAKLLESSDTRQVLNGIHNLKEKLLTKGDILSFVSDERPCFNILLSLLSKQMSTVLGTGFDFDKNTQNALRETLSLFSNLCQFSITVCIEVKSIPSVNNYFLRILESGEQTDIVVKATVLRLIGKICNFKESSAMLCQGSGLLDHIAMMINNNGLILADRALRVIRLLAKRPSLARTIILSNSCYYVGLRITEMDSVAEVRRRPDILQILLNLLRVYPKDVGRQLALSKCSSVLLDLFFCDDNVLEGNDNGKAAEGDAEKADISPASEVVVPSQTSPSPQPVLRLWKSVVLRLAQTSFEMREAFGAAAVHRVLSLAEIDGVYCDMLCCFSQDAWSRVILRESGALSRLLDILDDSTRCTPHYQMKIIASFEHFVFDTQSMAYLCQRSAFTAVALQHLRNFLRDNAVHCRPQSTTDDSDPFGNAKVAKSGKSGENFLKGQSTAGAQRKDKIIGETPSKKLFLNDSLSAAHSPPSMSSKCPDAWSPSMSPQYFHSLHGDASPFPPTSPTIADLLPEPVSLLDRSLFAEADESTILEEMDSLASESTADEMISEQPEKGHGSGRPANVEDTKAFDLDANSRRKVVESCLHIISKLSHQEENYPHLLKENILKTLIDYISDAPNFDTCLIRSLTRLIRSQGSPQILLEMRFHKMIIQKLIRRPCTLVRFSKLCQRCDKRRALGVELISEFARRVDSLFGYEFLAIDLNRTDDPAATREALMTGLTLIRSVDRARRFHEVYTPIPRLLSELSFILESCAKDDCELLTEEDKRCQLCCEIFVAFASLIHRRAIYRGAINGVEFDRVTVGKTQSLCFSEVNRSPPTLRNPCRLKTILAEQKPEKRADNLVFFVGAKNRSESSVKSLRTSPRKKNAEESKYVHDEEGEPLAMIPKDLLMTNRYFRGMFENEFAEKVEGRNRLYFNEDADCCSPQVFAKFLHYLIGCRNAECVAVDSAETCVGLIYLADKYMCTSLFEQLTTLGGQAQMVMRGDNLRHFVAPMSELSTVNERLCKVWILVLLCYATPKQVASLLNYFIENVSFIPCLIDWLSNFLFAFTPDSSFYLNYSMTPIFEV